MPDPFSLAAGWLQEHLILPLLYAVGGMEWEEIAFGWALFACYGAAQVAATFAICLPLERWRPVEHWPDHKPVWVDVLYTFISRVGVLPLVTFVLFYQIQVTLNGPDAAFMDGAGGMSNMLVLMHRGMSIAGGTSEIKRNQIGERILGLPRDPLIN